jgi:hypothetical protein
MSTAEYVADWGDHPHFPATGDPEWDHVLDEVAHPKTVQAERLLALHAPTAHNRVPDDAQTRSTSCTS